MLSCLRSAIFLAVFLCLGLSLAAAPCTADEAQDQVTLKALYDAAKQAGDAEVTVYTVYPQLQPMWDEFGRDFPGVTVRTLVIPGGGAPMFTRLAAEKASGNRVDDIVIAGLTDMTILIANDEVQPYRIPTSEGLDDRYREEHAAFSVPFANLFSLVYNTRLVAAKDLPRNLNEILAPKWAGKFSYARFSGSGASDISLMTLLYNHAISDEQLHAIKDNGMQAATNAALLAGVAQGRVAFGLWGPTHSAIPIQTDGAPIAFKFLPDSSVMASTGVAIVKDAPHTAAAKLLAAWLFTRKGQEEIAQHAHIYGTMPGAPVPPGSPATTGYHFTEPPLAEAAAAYARERQKVLEIWGQ